MCGANRRGECRAPRSGDRAARSEQRGAAVRAGTRKRAGVIRARETVRLVAGPSYGLLLILPALFVHVLKVYISVVRRCVACTMGVMGVFKWLRKDIVQRDRDQRSLTPKINGLNNEAYRNALQAFIDRRRSNPNETSGCIITPNSPDKERLDFFIKSKNDNIKENKRRNDETETRVGMAGVPHVQASDIFEIGWIAGTEDRYMELMFAEWQSTRVSLRRHTHPDCRDAVRADLEVLTEIRHPNVLLLMATTQTEDHGLVAIFEPVDCTLYNFVHEQGERVSVQGVARCAGNLAAALNHAHTRGYVHGAISSHCVFLATCGTVKLGGWELAATVNSAKTPRDYEHRLRYEIFKWQAPEIFKGHEPSKATDVYCLALLMWEMCTMNIPWNGLSKSELEAQYVQWKRGIVTDVYNFPPLLNKLLDAGLQLDVNKRTLDMGRMRRFLQTLEIQYEDADPIYVESISNNNNNNNENVTKSSTSPRCDRASETSPMMRRDEELTPRTRDETRILDTRKITARPLDLNLIEDESLVNAAEPRDLPSFTNDVTVPAEIFERVLKTTRVQRTNARNKVSTNEKRSEASKQRHETIGETSSPRTSEPETSPVSLTGRENEDDDTCCNEALVDMRKLRQTLADRRKDFFYGKDGEAKEAEIDRTSKAMTRIMSDVRSKDYEPHKPASHKTSLEPKPQRSPGRFNSNAGPTRCPAHKSQRSPYSCVPSAVRDAVVQPKILNTDSRGFFETSLWRKEKMICVAKMRKDRVDDATFRISPEVATITGCDEAKDESLKSDETYTLETTRRDATRSLDNNDYSCEPSVPRSESLRALKDSLDRATDIVLSSSAQDDDTLDKSPDDFETGASLHETVFEELYELRRDGDEEIRSIERANGTGFFVAETNEEKKAPEDSIRTRVPAREDTKRTFEAARLTGGGPACESIAESLHESSSDDSRLENETIRLERSRVGNEANKTIVSPIFDLRDDDKDEEAETSFALMIFGEKSSECHSCNTKSNLPRRRSLPAALGQLRNLSNVSLGKLPIRKRDVPDNTVEDIYIDDEFGDSLNVNMVLLDGDVTTDDEDFLPDLILSDTQDYP